MNHVIVKNVNITDPVDGNPGSRHSQQATYYHHNPYRQGWHGEAHHKPYVHISFLD